MAIVLTVKLGVKKTENGEFVEVVGALARDTETGEVKAGSFSGSREYVLSMLKLLETHPEVKIKYE